MRTDELVASCRAQLVQVEDWVRWLHSDGFQPAGRRGDSGPRPLRDDHNQDRDFVPGATFDTGLGDHRAREAFRAAWKPLRDADRMMAIALHIAGVTHQPTLPPRVEQLTLDVVVTTIAHLRARIRLLETAPPSTDIRVGTYARRSHTLIGEAWDILSAALHRGAADPDDQAVGELCRICNVRPRNDRKGGRCNTCDKWKTRNGTERPKDLDRDSTGEAVAAQRRRRRRGEGHGDESFSGARGA